MKKTTIALVVAGLVSTVAQAAPQANTFYVGAKAGWASVRHGLNQYQYRDESDGTVIGKAKINSEAYGIFGGYQITDHFAVEAGYEFFGRGKVKEFAGGLEYAILPELALRLEYQWLVRVGNFDKAERKKAEAYYGPNNYDESDVCHSPDIGSLSLGLSYRFGQNPVSVAQDTISATGYGKANPVTGNQCDAVKGRKALIACLADDRRVEIAVNGNQ